MGNGKRGAIEENNAVESKKRDSGTRKVMINKRFITYEAAERDYAARASD